MQAYFLLGLLVIFLLGLLAVVILLLRERRRKRRAGSPVPARLPQLLQSHIPFYRQLTTDEQAEFENRVAGFLIRTTVTGIGIRLSDADRVLVAASAIIPIFAFKGWRYNNISEVLVYPEHFSTDYRTDGPDRAFAGMVGTGPMNRQMILSLTDLRRGFMSETHHSHPGIHEFVHLLDKADGATDGIPEYLIPPACLQPWLQLMHREIAAIRAGESVLDPYAGLNQAEFFAVAAEYFFQQPEALQANHPELYNLLERIFIPQSTDT
jgi:Mlc titration factor MtfA (ptsG expression regulator)